MKEYIAVMKELLVAKAKDNRTGIYGMSKVFNHSEFNLDYGRCLPLVTTKSLPVKSVLGELLGFIRGASSAETFRQLGCNVWNANANTQNPPDLPQNKWLSNPWRKGEDDLGPIYGVQWRKWQDTKLMSSGDGDFLADLGYERIGQFYKNNETKMTVVWHREIDQLANVVNELRNNPNSRRIIISAWNPSDMESMALPPCHVLQHFLCEEMSEEERLEAYSVREENRAMWNNESREQPQQDILRHIRSVGNDKSLGEIMDEVKAPTHKLHLLMYQRSSNERLH